MADSYVGLGSVSAKAPRKQTIFDCAKNFISTERKSDGRYVPALNEEVLAELAQVKEKLVVVSAVGAYRTGKSYLLNRLSRHSGAGNKFTVGHTSQPQTKGLWLMVTDHPALPGYKLALIESEGIGDTYQGDTQHGIITFVLTCLLSDTMIYNGKTTIDETAFEKLGVTAEMSKYMLSKMKDEEDDESHEEAAIHKFFPELVYVIRDFALDLEEEDGRKITPDEYFENALAIKADEDPANSRVRVRKCIKKYFRRRRCFTLDPPATNKKILRKLNSVSDEELNPDFIASLAHLQNYILVESNASNLPNGRKVDGQQLSMMIEAYVNAFRSNDLPNVSAAMETMKNGANEKVVDNAEQKYPAYEETSVGLQTNMPTETMEVVEIHPEMVQQEDFAFRREKQTALVRFIDEKSAEGDLIMAKDKTLTENEKRSLALKYSNNVVPRELVEDSGMSYDTDPAKDGPSKRKERRTYCGGTRHPAASGQTDLFTAPGVVETCHCVCPVQHALLEKELSNAVQNEKKMKLEILKLEKDLKW